MAMAGLTNEDIDIPQKIKEKQQSTMLRRMSTLKQQIVSQRYQGKDLDSEELEKEFESDMSRQSSKEKIEKT